jgi:hypothetical protein
MDWSEPARLRFPRTVFFFSTDRPLRPLSSYSFFFRFLSLASSRLSSSDSSSDSKPRAFFAFLS